MRFAKKILSFLVPTPLDAWVFVTILFWSLAAIGSILWFAESPEIDPIGLPMPLLAGTLAMIAGLGLVAFSRGVSRKVLAMFFATIVVGGMIFLFAGAWLDMPIPPGIRIDNQKRNLTFQEFTQAYRWHPVFLLAVLLGTFLIASSTRWVQGFNSLLMTWIESSISFLNHHRTRIMITFFVIMFPATILRNAIDPEFRSSPYIVPPIMIGLLATGGIFATYLLGRLVLNQKWLALKIIAAIGTSIAASIYLLVQSISGSTYNSLENIGSDFSWAFVPAFFTFAFLAAAFTERKKDPSYQRRLFSVWTLLLTLPVFCLFPYLLHRYDPRVVVCALVEEQFKNSQVNWLQTAKDSRTIQRSTNGTTRLLDSYETPLYCVKIRDKRDANALRLLFEQKPYLSSVITIENIQPFVDTKPLDGFSAHLGILSGELTSDQMADLCKTIPSLVVADVMLPDQNDNTTLPPTFGTYSDAPIPGFTGFIDAYVSPRKNPVSINSPLTMEDWNSLLKVNQLCPFRVDFRSLPPNAFDATEIQNQKSLSGIFVYPLNLSYYSDAAWILETDMQIGSLQLRDEQLAWDFAFSKPKIKRNQPTFQTKPIPFEEAADRYHWAYGWDEVDAITHLWLPGIGEVIQHQGMMSKVRILRFDRRGFLGFRTIQRLDFSPLSALPNLQRLYLGSGEYFGDLRFLNKLNKLEHLQIQAQNRTGMPFSGFEVCQNLKTLRVFGTPHSKTIKELGGLKSLHRIEIVDDDLSFQTELELAELKSSLPGIRIRIIAPEDFQPDLSEKLQQHLEGIRMEFER